MQPEIPVMTTPTAAPASSQQTVRETIIEGQPLTTKTRIQEYTAEALQNFAPLKEFKLHLCGFAYYAEDPQRQVEFHHYCSFLNEDVVQCCVFDGPERGARLVGVEYVISTRLYETLDAEEKKLWHAHNYDIKSGSFYAPGLPSVLEKPLAKELSDTYGKTWMLWQTDKGDPLPLGMPKLMLVANRDGQWNPNLFTDRAARLGTTKEELDERRKDLVMPKQTITPDQWTAQPFLHSGTTSQ